MLCALTFAWPGQAEAHFVNSSGRFVFGGGHTSLDRGRQEPGLPINLMFYPRAYIPNEDGIPANQRRLGRHLEEHLHDNVTDEDGLDIIPTPHCPPGTRFLAFPARDEPRVRNDNHVVIWTSQDGIEDRCHNRIHLRTWFDTNHSGGTHAEPQTWITTQIHYDSHQKLHGDKTHVFIHSFDIDEALLIAGLRRTPEHADHFDPRERNPTSGHCADFHWRPHAGSRGWFGASRTHSGKGFRSDGWMSRISMNHCRR